MKPKTVKIMVDFLSGPIWPNYFDPKTKKHYTGVDVVDNDPVLKKLNDEIQDMYLSYFHFDYKDLPCWVDEEQQKADKPKMLALIQKLHDRLDEINDGSFVVVDEETPYLEAL